jgi:hypothetical protein
MLSKVKENCVFLAIIEYFTKYMFIFNILLWYNCYLIVDFMFTHTPVHFLWKGYFFTTVNTQMDFDPNNFTMLH